MPLWKKYLALAMIIAGLDGAVGSLVYKGWVDPDFFSYYYVGRGVIDGKRMYRDFTDNKGPILHFFSSGLYFVFGDNYKPALAFGSWVLDCGIMFGMVIMMDRWWGIIRRPWWQVGMLVVTVGLYMKSFTLGAIYAESLGMVFIVWALVAAGRSRWAEVGMLWALGTFTRQTLALVLPYFIYELWVNRSSLKEWLKFIGGGLAVGLGVIVFLTASNDLVWFAKNAVLFNLNYARAVAGLGWAYLAVELWDSGMYRTLFGIQLFLVLSGYMLKTKDGKWRKLFVLGISLLAATYVGGISHDHHFLQFSVVVAMCMGGLLVGVQKTRWAAAVLATFGLIAMGFFWTYWLAGEAGTYGSYITRPEEIPEIEAKKYLEVMIFYPKLYFDYNKTAPDRYFQPFFISSYFNSQWREEVARHKASMKERAADTAFLFIKSAQPGRVGLDQRISQEYLDNFGESFGLEKVAAYEIQGGEVSVYWSKKPDLSGT